MQMWELGVSLAVQLCDAVVPIQAGFIQAHSRVMTGALASAGLAGKHRGMPCTIGLS